MSVDKDLASVQQARDLVEAAHRAQTLLTQFDQNKIDCICESMAQAALREAARLGLLAVEETGYGIPADKAEKNRFASEDVWNYFRTLRTVGCIAESKEVMEIASPRGVVAAIIPSTNPTSTAIFKSLIAIKSRNAIVLSPHPSAVRCINESVRVVRDAAVKEGLPTEAIGCMTTATIEGTELLMKHKLTAVILATGGIGLVRAAYSSGKPAFGVGPGNVPVFIERTADAAKAVQDILTGKCFDNGTICASEQAVIVDVSLAKTVRGEFEAQGAHFLSAAEADQLAQVVATEQRTLNPGIVGKSVDVIAKMAGLNVPAGTRCLIAEVGGVGREHPLSMEKLSPILAFYTEDGMERAAARCFEVLSYGGMGHTAGIHTRSREMAKAFGTAMPASRVVVNTPTTHGAIGFSTALPPSMTLGCGSWGGNVTSDNISPLHLMDIKRVAFETRPVQSTRPRTATGATQSAVASSATSVPTITREEIALIVDRFLAARSMNQATPTNELATNAPPLRPTASPAPVQAVIDIEANRLSSANESAAPHPESAPNVQTSGGDTQQSQQGQDGQSRQDGSEAASSSAREKFVASQSAPTFTPTAVKANVAEPTNGGPATSPNGRHAVEFVCEDDVRQALQRGEKIYVTARTIITPAAHDIGDAAEIFARA